MKGAAEEHISPDYHYHLVHILETTEIVKGDKEIKLSITHCANTSHPIRIFIQELTVNMANQGNASGTSDGKYSGPYAEGASWHLHVRWVCTILASLVVGMVLWAYESKGTTRLSEMRAFNFCIQGGLLVLSMNFPVH